jgi:hypothetical protein
MTTQRQIEANRLNAPKSTGPRSAEGKERSRFNALKHGMNATIPVLPGEDSEAFTARIDAWTADLQPRNDVALVLVEQSVQTSWQLERAQRAETARLTSKIRAATAGLETDQRQQEEAPELGQRLFRDRRGPIFLYPHHALRHDDDDPDDLVRTSWADDPDDPDEPSRLVRRLEATAASCQWLLDQWAALRSRLNDGLAWHSPDKLKAIRLLGRQPLGAVDDTDVCIVFLAGHVLDPKHRYAFHELYSELHEGEIHVVRQRLDEPTIAPLRPRDKDEARAALLSLVDRSTSRLDQLAALPQSTQPTPTATHPLWHTATGARTRPSRPLLPVRRPGQSNPFRRLPMSD